MADEVGDADARRLAREVSERAGTQGWTGSGGAAHSVALGRGTADSCTAASHVASGGMARGLVGRALTWWNVRRARERAWCKNCEEYPRRPGDDYCSDECSWGWLERTGM